MPTEQRNSSRSIITSRQALKRSYSQSVATARSDHGSDSVRHQQPHSNMSLPRRPWKAARVDESLEPRTPGSPSSRFSDQTSSRSSKAPRGSHSKDRGHSRKSKKLELPERDISYIQRTFKPQVDLSAMVEENPKNFLVNFTLHVLDETVPFQTQEGYIGRDKFIRSSITIATEPPIIGEGDGMNRKDAEKLACLSVVYQLVSRSLLDPSGRIPKSVTGAAVPSVHELQATLSDGQTVVGYERARQFMDFYCRRYGFGKEEVTSSQLNSKKHTTEWEAVMTVGGKRIGIGKASSKKLAQQSCYVDVAQYLEKCDPALWETFVEAAKTGKDLGLAPRVYCQTSSSLEQEIYDLCSDMRKSMLYRNARVASISDTTTQSSAPIPATSSIPRRHLRPLLNEKSQRLMERKQEYLADPRMETMRTIRANLPVSVRSSELLKHIQENHVTVCMAATGSGKTTQIPQLILDDWIDRGEGAKCNVICTQPRRIAAISVAERVAKERGEILGKSVGYQVRFEAKIPEEHGSITFCTTGIFLKRMQSALLKGSTPMGRSLDDVTHIVVDEVHERDVDTDLLLVVLKRLLADRKAKNNPIKVILMSATIDPTLFREYFPDDQGRPAPVLEIPGRSFPVEKHYLDDFLPHLTKYQEASRVFAQEPVAKYLVNELGPTSLQSVGLPTIGRAPMTPVPDGRENKLDDLELPYPLIALTVAHVLRSSDSGHVLVFVPGWEDIMAVQRSLLDPIHSLGLNFQDRLKWSIHLLHSTIPVAEQQQIFEPPPPGVRRIILATNIAETSVTIPDVVYVVDTGKIKEQRFDPERHISSLVSAWVGTSNLNQRAGRAGRHRPGQYFGILGRRRASELHAYQTVEMKRVDLSNIVMHVKALNFPGMLVEEVLAATIEPPAAERVAAAMKDLQMVGALDARQNLTSLGRVLLQLPVEVQMGRLVLFGSFFKCLDQALTLAAILTNRDPFVSPMHLKTEAAWVKASWTSSDFRSDTLAILKAYNAWWELQGNGEYVSANKFCNENFLSKPTLLMIQKIKGQLLQSLYHAGVLDVSAGNNIEIDNTFGRRKDVAVPSELNVNGDSIPLLVALVAIASQPKFAIRTGERVYRTAQDKITFIHPSSVNHRKREGPESEGLTLGEKQIIAFSEKRQNMSVMTPGTPQKFLVTTTRLDPMSYMLFGAFSIRVTEKGLECDDWLPIVGNIGALDQISRLKDAMDLCMLRVYEGISRAKRNRQGRVIMPRREGREGESEDDEDIKRDYSLTATEIAELDVFTRDIVRILNRYSDERIAYQSRANSRPATPVESPLFGLARLPRSGQATPYNIGSTYNSRPGTPSRLGPSRK